MTKSEEAIFESALKSKDTKNTAANFPFYCKTEDNFLYVKHVTEQLCEHYNTDTLRVIKGMTGEEYNPFLQAFLEYNDRWVVITKEEYESNLKGK